MSDKVYLTVAQTAEYLGYKERTVYEIIKKRKIPFCKQKNNRVLFLEDDLKEYLNDNRRLSDSELTEKLWRERFAKKHGNTD